MKFFYVFGLVLAALAAVGTAVAVANEKGPTPVMTVIAGVGLALFLLFMARLYRDVSLMLCDASDASIKSAELLQQLLAEKRHD
ncbi:MAG: hypothetical protein WBK26_12130 [Burkholderiaceae bacterium]